MTPSPPILSAEEAARPVKPAPRDWQTFLGWAQNAYQSMPADKAQAAIEARDALIRSEARAKASVWQPIESAPKDGTHILVALKRRIYEHDYDYNFIPVRAAYWSARRQMWNVQNSIMAKTFITHWMLLPQPPRSEGDV